MKRSIVFILLLISISAFSQVGYGTRIKYNFRKSAVDGAIPPVIDFNYSPLILGWNGVNGILYAKWGNAVYAAFRIYLYTDSIQPTYVLNSSFVQSYSNAIYPTYIRENTVAGNLPPLSDFTYANTWAISWPDSCVYTKEAGVRVKKYRIYTYSITIPVYPTLPSRIYVATNGSDASLKSYNPNTAFKSIYKASTVAVAGDTIILLPGTFTETAQSNIRAGVIIKGQGIGITNVVSSYTYAPAPTNVSYALFTLKNTVITNGNQTISGISFYGNNTCYRAISVYKRNNVTIRDCSFNNFKGSATIFYNDANNNVTQPAAYASGNQFINNTVTNCTSYGISYAGALTLLAQQNATVSGNVMIDERRSDTGYTLISGLSNRKINIYNNTFKKATKYLTYWPFTVEMRYNHGEISFYNNISEGVVDITYNFKQLLAFGLNIYGNTFGSNVPGVHQIGVELEADNRGVRVYDNIFKNLEYGMSITTNINTAALVDSVAITRNLFSNIGYPATRFTGGAIRMSGSTTYTAIPQYRNVMITNNTIVGNGYAVAGIWLQRKGYYDDFKVTNNIIYNFDLSYGGVYLDKDAAQTMAVDSLAMNYNLVFLTGNTNNPKYLNITPSNTTYLNTVKSDPMLNSGYQLLPGSPAINGGFGGINIGKY